MGVARPRGVTKYVVVRRTGMEIKEESRDLDIPMARRQADISKISNLEFDRADDDYDDDLPSPTVSGSNHKRNEYGLTTHSLLLR